MLSQWQVAVPETIRPNPSGKAGVAGRNGSSASLGLFGIAAMAVRSLVFGTGGCSSRFNTKRLSRSDSLGLPQSGLQDKSPSGLCASAPPRV